MFGATLAEVYDHLIIADPDPRRRNLGETSGLVRAGALDSGIAESKVEVVIDPILAIDHAFSIVGSGDLIVVQVDEVDPMLKRVMEHFERIVGTGLSVLKYS